MEEFETEIKEKIRKNSKELSGYLLEFACVESKCDSDNCIVMYEGETVEELDFTSITFSEVDIKNEPKEETVELKNKFRNLIYSLNLISRHFFREQISIKRAISSISFFEYSKSYLRFIKCINLKDRRCVEEFDMDVFYTIFYYDYLDDNIVIFTKKLVDDPLNYSLENKQDCIVLLIYVFVYCSTHKLKHSHLIFEKLKSCIVFTKTTSSYKIKLTNDVFIDKYVLKLKRMEFEEDSIFLNYFYSKYVTKPNLDREVFNDFQARLHRTLEMIPEEYLMNFIRNVFFKHSVLYSCVNDLQVVKSIVDFYEKIVLKNRNETIFRSIYDFLILLALKVPGLELFRCITEQSQRIFYGDKYILIKVLSIGTLSDLQSLIDSHKESFNLVKQIIDVYYKILSNISCPIFREEKSKMEMLCEFLDLHIFIFQNLQSNFLIKFFNRHIKGFTAILEEVHRRLIQDEEDKEVFLSFNDHYWDTFSKIVLQIHKFIIMIDSENKKDKKKVKNTPLNKTVDIFLNIIYKIEEKLVQLFGEERVKKLKSRSFEVVDKE